LGAVAGASVLQWLDRREVARPAAAPSRPQKVVPVVQAPVAPAAPAAAAPVAPPVSAPAAPAPAPQALQAEAPKPPAQVVPALPVAPAPAALLAAEQLRRLDGYGAGRNLLLRERLAATREKLAAAPDASYSIELFLADNSSPERAERFLQRARDLVPLSEVYVIPVTSGTNAGGSARYKLRVNYGVFANRDAAAEAAKRLPPKYQNAFKFELRSLAELRAAI
jgi:hypothetical protein